MRVAVWVVDFDEPVVAVFCVWGVSFHLKDVVWCWFGIGEGGAGPDVVICCVLGVGGGMCGILF